jgi:hypothetical protein
MRVKSEVWVKAYLRRCQAEAVPVVIARRGDEAAGAIFICINRLDGTVSLYGPAPSGTAGGETERRWVNCLGSGPASAEEADRYLNRQREFDPDIWIVEVEDKAGRHFLGDLAIES